MIRRLSNTGKDESQEVRKQTLEEYFCTLRMSGYSEPEIKKYAIAAITGYERRVVREAEGGAPVHREKTNIRKSTYRKKLTLRQDWYCKHSKKYTIKRWGSKVLNNKKIGCKNNPPKCPSIHPKIKRGALAARIREVESKINEVNEIRVKVVEEEGIAYRIF